MIPQYMDPGSVGPCVTALQLFLSGRLKKPKKSKAPAAKVRFGVYDDATVELVKRFQHGASIQKDGKCGPLTRAKLEAAGFPFDEIAMSLPGITLFAHEGGEPIPWSAQVEQVALMETPTARPLDVFGLGPREEPAAHDATPESEEVRAVAVPADGSDFA